MSYGAFWGRNDALIQLVLSSWEPEASNSRMHRIDREAPGYRPQNSHFHETLRSRLLHYQQQQGYVRDVMSLSFGAISHVSLDTNMVHSRHNKGDDQHMVRYDAHGNSDLIYESCKFDMRLNPIRSRPGNWDPRYTPVTYSRSFKFLAKLAQFPYCTGLPTIAPFRQKPKATFKQPRVTQTCAFTKVWNVPELRAIILEAGHLYTSFPALANLGLACQAFFADISGDIMCLDTTTCMFQNLDKSDAEMDALVKKGKITAEERAAGRAATFLAIMPVRRPLIKTPKYVPNRFGEDGWYDGTGLELPAPQPTQQLNALGKTFKMVLHHGNTVRNLQLHRVAFLDLKSVEAIVSGTPNLKSLGIYNCELMHVGITEALLKYVGGVNESRGPVGDFLDIDFSPRYHLGPLGSRTGSYGATWSDPHQVPNSSNTMVVYDSSLALAVIGLRAARLAKKFGFELFEHHKAFRNWWERIPFGYGQSSQIAYSIMNILAFEKNGIAQAAETYSEAEEVWVFDQLYAAMKHTVHLDLLISASGKPESPGILHQRVYMNCRQCGEDLLPGFFDDTVKMRRANQRVCIGCQFQAYVANERDHQKEQRQMLIGDVWADAPSLTVQWLLESDDGKQKWATAKSLAEFLQEGMPRKFRALLEENERLLPELQQRYADARNRRERDPIRAEIKAVESRIKGARVFLFNEQEDPIPGRKTIRDWDYLRKWYFYRQRMEQGRENNDGPHFMFQQDADKHFNL